MQIWAESGKSALPICNYSQILYQFLTFTQNLKRSRWYLNDFQSLKRQPLFSQTLHDIFYSTTPILPLLHLQHSHTPQAQVFESNLSLRYL